MSFNTYEVLSDPKSPAASDHQEPHGGAFGDKAPRKRRNKKPSKLRDPIGGDTDFLRPTAPELKGAHLQPPPDFTILAH
jgi:hypothetical protein